ncbi:IS3 family transposase, partial [Dokdonella sp.]|uniref:IS3 family transposase n=1 Tax=Dokdonella sp. TaxID=2291710 RepID=UPI00261127BB
MVTPAQRREAVGWLRKEKSTSERLACRIVRQPRATQRRRRCGRLNGALEAEVRLLELAQAHAAWGCPKLHRQLRHEGHRINHKRTERLYRQHGLSIRRRRRRRLVREVRHPLLQPIRPGQSWSMDFMGDSLADGRAYRTFNVIDDYARDALAIEIDVSLTAQRVVRVLERLCEWHGAPESIRSDNGPEFRSDALQSWAKGKGIRWDFIQPGCPAQNGYIERFNGTYRLEVLDANQFRSLDEARAITEDWLA